MLVLQRFMHLFSTIATTPPLGEKKQRQKLANPKNLKYRISAHTFALALHAYKHVCCVSISSSISSRREIRIIKHAHTTKPRKENQKLYNS